MNGTITRYVYDNEDIIAEYDGNNQLIASYTHGTGIDEPISMTNGQTYYYHTDASGSIIAITNSTGNVVQRYEYDSFGNIVSVLNPNFVQPYTYTSREYDPESGLYFYRARYYDAETGRFINEDPIGFKGGDVNFYAYVGNDPVNNSDPLGLFGFTGPGFLNLRPEGSNSICKNPYDECVDNAKKFRETCTKLLWLAQAKCTALCAIGCIGSGPGYFA